MAVNLNHWIMENKITISKIQANKNGTIDNDGIIEENEVLLAFGI